MGKTVVALVAAFLFLGTFALEESLATPAPLPPETGRESLSPTLPTTHSNPEPQSPMRVIIPNIKLDAAIQNVEINARGQMDVPPERSRKVGWYSLGTVPGSIGSAVFAAHVTDAFKNLHKAERGDHIYVITKDGYELDYIVESTATYRVEDVSAEGLFNRRDGRYLHLITCAGKPLGGTAYSHRLIVYAKLAGS
jgi:LPXTG-site transpeptidase (sortase) family protein